MKEFTMKYFQTDNVKDLIKESDKINKILNREKLTGRLGAIKQRQNFLSGKKDIIAKG
jgi:hypothetical protein